VVVLHYVRVRISRLRIPDFDGEFDGTFLQHYFQWILLSQLAEQVNDITGMY